MQQETELEVVKRKIRRFAEVKQERGYTEDEVYIAMVNIGKLLDRFNLNMSEVMLQKEKCVVDYFDTLSKHRNVTFSSAIAVAKFCQVKVWQRRNQREYKGIVLGVFGLEPDVKMAMYLFDIIRNASEKATTEFKQTVDYILEPNKRNVTFSFYSGMAINLSRRLNAMTSQREEEASRAAEHTAKQMKDRMVGASDEAIAEASRQTTGTALMIVKKKEHVQDEYNKFFGIDTTKKKRGRKRSENGKKSAVKARNYTGHEAGKAAGEKVNLSRPLANASYGKTLLLT